MLAQQLPFSAGCFALNSIETKLIVRLKEFLRSHFCGHPLVLSQVIVLLDRNREINLSNSDSSFCIFLSCPKNFKFIYNNNNKLFSSKLALLYKLGRTEPPLT